MNIHDYTQLPPHMMGALIRYLEQGIPPGGFLSAVLRNDLRSAVMHADHVNMMIIPVYVSYLTNRCPTGCWGSEENVEWWIDKARSEEHNYEHANFIY